MKMKMKMIMFGLVVCILLGSGFQLKGIMNSSHSSFDSSVAIQGKAALLIEADSGNVLYAKNDREQLFPASTTKILTALLAIEHGNLDEPITVGEEASLKTSGESTAWLKQGQTLTLRELLAGLMLPSGNDAARTIAVYTAKKEMSNAGATGEDALDYFVEMMNKRAKKLGAVDSHFMNPHGLHHPNHYSTAHDLGLIAMAAMENKSFKEIVSSKIFRDEAITYENRNQLLDDNSPFYYHGANGIKTGFTDEAGYCLVSSAERNGKKVIAVVLKSTKGSIWNDSIALLEKGFEKEYVRN